MVVVCDQVMCEGGPSWCQTPKPRCQGSVLANKMWRVLFLGRGDNIGVGYTRFDVVVVCDQGMCKGGQVGAKSKIEELGLSSGQRNVGRLFLGRRTLFGWVRWVWHGGDAVQ